MRSLNFLISICVLATAASAFASGDYTYVEGYPMGRCRLASKSKTKNVQPLAHNANCTLNVNYYYTGYSSNADLTPPIPYYPNFKSISFWVEVQNSKSSKWSRISSIRKILRNGITKQVVFNPSVSGNYRVAFDEYDQVFADRYSESFSLSIK